MLQTEGGFDWAAGWLQPIATATAIQTAAGHASLKAVPRATTRGMAGAPLATHKCYLSLKGLSYRRLSGRMTRVVERLLGLHPGEGRRGLLLFSYLFLVISSLVASKATRDALFLEHFSAVQLPYVDIAIAILVGGVVSVYLRLSRRLDLAALQAGSLVALSLVSLTFWLLAREGGHSTRSSSSSTSG